MDNHFHLSMTKLTVFNLLEQFCLFISSVDQVDPLSKMTIHSLSLSSHRILTYTNMVYVYAISQSGGPSWDVPKGRKDGRKSQASETTQLPAPTFNISQLQKSFSQRGLSIEDLVALSGKQFQRQKLHHLLFQTLPEKGQ